MIYVFTLSQLITICLSKQRDQILMNPLKMTLIRQNIARELEGHQIEKDLKERSEKELKRLHKDEKKHKKHKKDRKEDEHEVSIRKRKHDRSASF